MNYKQSVFSALALALLGFSPSTSLADPPLDLETLKVGQRKLRLGVTMEYLNRDLQTVSTDRFVNLDIGGGATIQFPTLIGTSRSNIESIGASLGLNYGITDAIDIYTQLRSQNTVERFSTVSGLARQTYSSSSFTMGGSLQLTQGVVGSIEYTRPITLDSTTLPSAASIRLGITAYRAYDPIVLSISSSFTHPEATQTADNSRFRSGDAFSVAPRVYFAANEQFTLGYGVQLLRRGATNVSGSKVSNVEVTTRGILSVGYAPSRSNLVIASLTFDLSGDGGATLASSWFHDF